MQKKIPIYLVLVLITSHRNKLHPFYLSFHKSCGINSRECFRGPAAPQQGMLGVLIVWWPASFWLQWTVAEGTVYGSSPAKFPTHRGIRMEMYAMKQITICSEDRDMLLRPQLVCQVHLGFRPLASAQVSDKPALAWVACSVFCTDLNLYN